MVQVGLIRAKGGGYKLGVWEMIQNPRFSSLMDRGQQLFKSELLPANAALYPDSEPGSDWDRQAAHVLPPELYEQFRAQADRVWSAHLAALAAPAESGSDPNSRESQLDYHHSRSGGNWRGMD